MPQAICKCPLLLSLFDFDVLCQTMDYLGDVVAGGEVEMYANK